MTSSLRRASPRTPSWRRLRLLTFGLAAVLAGATATVRAEESPAPWSDAPPRFPLIVEPGRRHLVDADGVPFFIHGDTAWSLMVELDRENAELYLEDRRARGFNAILVNLIERKFSRNPPANAYGEEPFLSPGDFGTPNERYFAHAEWILNRAAEKGMLVFLTPSYAGIMGGDEGWYRDMAANGPAKLRDYGRYLGRRFGDAPNLVWVHGGDFNPPNKDLVRAIAEGVREVDPDSLHTAHGAPETAALDYWAGEPWLQIDDVYTYDPVYAAALKQYARPEAMPFFLLESAYENEHGVDARRLRVQAYHAALSGAAGHVFGNNPIWHFEGPGVHPSDMHWTDALDSPGARGMTHLRTLISGVAWHELEPDADAEFLLDGHRSGQERAVAALARDGSFGLAYAPSWRGLTIDLGRLRGPLVAARWFDPAAGRFFEVEGSPFPAQDARDFLPESRERARDWALLLESVDQGDAR